jgi:hypothetical protein
MPLTISRLDDLFDTLHRKVFEMRSTRLMQTALSSVNCVLAGKFGAFFLGVTTESVCAQLSVRGSEPG